MPSRLPSPALTLLPHQHETVNRLIASGSLFCALPAGAGKTLATLHALGLIFRNQTSPRGAYALTRRALILAPAPLLGVWRAELARHGGALGLDGVQLIEWRGSPAQRVKLAGVLASHTPAQAPLVVVCSYETYRQDADVLASYAWDLVALDESGKIRNPTAKLTKAVTKLAEKSAYRLCLDGNPVSNSIADLFAPCSFLQPGVLGASWWKFRASYAIMSPYIQGKIDGWRNTDEIKERVKPLLYWRKKEDILPDLPEKVETVIPVALTSAERTRYKKIEEEFMVDIRDETVLIENALVKLMRLRQATFGSLCFVEDTLAEPLTSKEQALIALLESIGVGKKVVVFSQFETVIRALTARLSHASSCPLAVHTITGSTRDREAVLESFAASEPDKLTVLFGTSAIERGLNLQMASYMIHLDLPWSFASYDQRIGRIWRQGQKERSIIYTLEAEKTVDVRIRKLLEKKIAIAEDVSSAALGLTRRELVELFEEPF